MNVSTTHLLIKKRKIDAVRSKTYAAALENSPLLNEARFSVKDVRSCVREMTYRKINDWDAKGLISGSRKGKEAGWRKFSITDLVKLRIIADLREFGFTTEKIRDVLRKSTSEMIEVMDHGTGEREEKEFRALEYYLHRALDGENTLLLVHPDGQVIFSPHEDALLYHTAFLEEGKALLILPFHSYIKEMQEVPALKNLLATPR